MMSAMNLLRRTRLLFAGLAVVMGLAIPQSTALAAYSITYVSDTYSSNCLSGRICINQITQNNCSTICRAFNANGGSNDWAWSNTGWSVGERGYNRNTGSYRDTCMYKWSSLNAGGGARRVYYGAGWTALPFTGVASMEAINQSWLCTYQYVYE
jgi:hypothetical protein